MKLLFSVHHHLNILPRCEGARKQWSIFCFLDIYRRYHSTSIYQYLGLHGCRVTLELTTSFDFKKNFAVKIYFAHEDKILPNPLLLAYRTYD